MDLRSGVTHINLGMYLIVTPSPYSGDDLMNYKSLTATGTYYLAGLGRC